MNMLCAISIASLSQLSKFNLQISPSKWSLQKVGGGR